MMESSRTPSPWPGAIIGAFLLLALVDGIIEMLAVKTQPGS
jgi:hypothetical protein